MVHAAHTASSHQTLQRSFDLPRKGISFLVRADLGSSIQEVRRQIYRRGELADGSRYSPGSGAEPVEEGEGGRALVHLQTFCSEDAAHNAA